jgi:hypothetical protein
VPKRKRERGLGAPNKEAHGKRGVDRDIQHPGTKKPFQRDGATLRIPRSLLHKARRSLSPYLCAKEKKKRKRSPSILSSSPQYKNSTTGRRSGIQSPLPAHDASTPSASHPHRAGRKEMRLPTRRPLLACAPPTCAMPCRAQSRRRFRLPPQAYAHGSSRPLTSSDARHKD